MASTLERPSLGSGDFMGWCTYIYSQCSLGTRHLLAGNSVEYTMRFYSAVSYLLFRHPKMVLPVTGTSSKHIRYKMSSAMPWKTLTSTTELKQRLLSQAADDSLVILDAAFVGDKSDDAYHNIYLKGHIPGARFFDLHACVNSTPLIPRNMPETYCFTKRIRGLGIDGTTEIVVYDHSDTPEAATRTWWLFRLFGHNKISVLDGGYQKWVKDGYDVRTEPPKESADTNYVVKLDTALIRDMEDMKGIIKGNTVQVVDARNEGLFTGQQDHSETLTGGHVPNAKNLPNKSLFNEDGTYKSPEEICDLFSKAGVDVRQPLVSMCRTGMMACSLAAAAHQIGLTTVPVYYGSWMEWAQINKTEDLIEKGTSV